MDACRQQGIEHMVLGGGVAANSRLRAVLDEDVSVRALRCGCHARLCAPTTVQWLPPWGLPLSNQATRPRVWALRWIHLPGRAGHCHLKRLPLWLGPESRRWSYWLSSILSTDPRPDPPWWDAPGS